jgi:threonine synthase
LEYQKQLQERVKFIEKEQKYALTLTKANDVLMILDLPDEEDDFLRAYLLKLDNKSLEDLAKQSKERIENYVSILIEDDTKQIEIKETREQSYKKEQENNLDSKISIEDKIENEHISKIR